MWLQGEGQTPSSWGDTADFVRHGDDRRGFRAELITFFIDSASDRPGVQFRISIIDFIAIVQSQNWGGGGGRGAMKRRRQLAQFGYPNYSLLDEYTDTHYEIARDDAEILANELYCAHVTYDKYHQLSDARKELFRRIILAGGTQLCVDAARERDLTKPTTMEWMNFHPIMILTFEVRDKYDGAFDQNIDIEITASMNDVMFCPRQMVRFFHRRNSCDCLQDIYYKLKETTNKTSLCHNCSKVVEIKQLSRCDYCDIVQYCSDDCALAHWPKHKVTCERWGCSISPQSPQKYPMISRKLIRKSFFVLKCCCLHKMGNRRGTKENKVMCNVHKQGSSSS
eukprot:scaffold7169_cov76-Cyclotella_meneghiniana.AAC.5